MNIITERKIKKNKVRIPAAWINQRVSGAMQPPLLDGKFENLVKFTTNIIN